MGWRGSGAAQSTFGHFSLRTRPTLDHEAVALLAEGRVVPA
jgi:hypothetical protein